MMKMPCYRVDGDDTYVQINSFGKSLTIDDLEGLIEFLQLEISQMKRRQEREARARSCVYVIQRCKGGAEWHEFTERVASIDEAVAMIKRLRTLTGETEEEWRVRNIKTGAMHLPARDLI